MSDSQYNIIYELCRDNAKQPTKGTEYSAGYDLYSCSEIIIKPGTGKLIDTGVKIQMPSNFAGFIYDRSGIATKFDVFKAAGVIDADYRGEVKVYLFNHSEREFILKEGERFSQIVFVTIPAITMTEGKLETTNRGEGGFGSTGRK